MKLQQLKALKSVSGGKVCFEVCKPKVAKMGPKWGFLNFKKNWL